MSLIRYFELVVLALVVLVVAASLAAIGHRLRQKSLQKIPGPPNPSRFWGNVHSQDKLEHMLKGWSRSLAPHVQPLRIFVS
jgi:hypothetical protein